MRYRLERYREEQVEPRAYKEAEEQILRERAKQGHRELENVTNKFEKLIRFVSS